MIMEAWSCGFQSTEQRKTILGLYIMTASKTLVTKSCGMPQTMMARWNHTMHLMTMKSEIRW